jgi:DNA repair protein RecN (Recombination protein N)
LLKELRIKDLGIIESIDWSLEDGLNIITGETGAGKSLVIDAIEALVEGRAADEDIRHGSRETRVEGVFTVRGTGDSKLAGFLAEKGLADESGILVVSCDVRRQSRGTIRVNGQAVPRSVLRQIMSLLVDVHGQSEHLSLLDKRTHIGYLDAYARTDIARERFQAFAMRLAAVEEELQRLMALEKERARREEYLRYEIAEIERARLKVGEEEELERERQVLSSAEDLKALSYQAYRALHGEDISPDFGAALDRIMEAGRIVRRLAEVDRSLAPQARTLEASALELEEVARELYAYSETIEYEPERLRAVEARLELIAGLKRKYGDSVERVLAYLDRVTKELRDLEQFSEKRAGIEKERILLRQDMARLAQDLSKARTEAAVGMMEGVQKELQALGLGEARFVVSVTQTRTDDDRGLVLPDGASYVFTRDGIDNVEFMVSTNPGEPVKPLAKIASTGEMSRFMLAIKSALGAADQTPVMVFDEIDIGVGGRSGEAIGKKLWRLARNRQVICVTHLPQIAAFGDAHFRVSREVSGGRTISVLSSLQGESRVRELATMIAGAKLSDASVNTARELLNRASAWKAVEGGPRQARMETG